MKLFSGEISFNEIVLVLMSVENQSNILCVNLNFTGNFRYNYLLKTYLPSKYPILKTHNKRLQKVF